MYVFWNDFLTKELIQVLTIDPEKYKSTFNSKKLETMLSIYNTNLNKLQLIQVYKQIF